MLKWKAVIIVASFLVMGFLVFRVFLSDPQQVTVASQSVGYQPEKTVSGEEHDQSGGDLFSVSEEDKDHELHREEGQREILAANTVQEESTMTEEIKEKVKEVIQGTINLFKKDLRIVAIGDSLTEGIGDETKSEGYVGILNHTFEENQLNIVIDNYGKQGNRTDQLLKRLDQKEIANSIKKADIILITIGANDVMKVAKENFANLQMEPFEKEKPEFQARLTSIFEKINELNPNIQIYLLGFYNPFERYFGNIEEFGLIVENWNLAGEEVTEEFENAAFIPTADLFSQTDINLLADDHFHPNTSGYKLMAERVLESMEEIIVDQAAAVEGEEKAEE